MNERRPTDVELMRPIGKMVAAGLARALAEYEERAPHCRPCIGRACWHMSEADSPYCPECRQERAQMRAAIERVSA